jgi:hypothetical protein
VSRLSTPKPAEAPKASAAVPAKRAASNYGSDAAGRKIYVAPTIPDPGIVHGSFRVLQRTDGVYIVVDQRRPPGDRTIARFHGGKGKKVEEIRREAELECIRLAKEAGETA